MFGGAAQRTGLAWRITVFVEPILCGLLFGVAVVALTFVVAELVQLWKR